MICRRRTDTLGGQTGVVALRLRLRVSLTIYFPPMRYTAIFEAQRDGGYHAFCPALPGCHSEGDTLDEAIVNIREAVAVYLESLAAHGESAPVEDILIKALDVPVTT